jgi:hypothetical protein
MDLKLINVTDEEIMTSLEKLWKTIEKVKIEREKNVRLKERLTQLEETIKKNGESLNYCRDELKKIYKS